MFQFSTVVLIMAQGADEQAAVMRTNSRKTKAEARNLYAP
jgi:hypothetical protein